LAVGDRSFILTRDTNELIAWGSNEKGQLGLGHFDDVHMPTKIDFFTKVGQQVHSVSGGGDLNMASTHTGDSYVWPYTKQGKQYSVPVRMPFSAKVKIARVSCGHNFGFFISSQGLVYSLGKDNSDG
jgi:alpha-tubulin suppressor-like RCC1 family protein